jgi:hypothetical protein
MVRKGVYLYLQHPENRHQCIYSLGSSGSNIPDATDQNDQHSDERYDFGNKAETGLIQHNRYYNMTLVTIQYITDVSSTSIA